MAPARRAAMAMLEALVRPMAPGLDALLEEQRHALKLDARDAALARELAWGVCRHRRWLQHLLAPFLKRGFDTLDPLVQNALLLGAFQAAFLERVPPHAIVGESVELAGALHKGARSFVNAVLRRIVEMPAELRRPGAEAPWPVAHSIPEWMVPELVEALGGDQQEAASFARACNQPPPLHGRLRVGGLDDVLREVLELDNDATVEPGNLTGSVRLAGAALHPGRIASFARGDWTVEDEGAQVVGWIAAAGLGPGARALDLCASPGGKTAHLLDLVPGVQVVATDVNDDKLTRLTQTLGRLGLAGRATLALAAPHLADPANQGAYDLVLVDAPCSGLGTLRRHPEVRWRRDPEALWRLAGDQLDLLRAAAALVRPGGHLLYSVCTFAVAETEGVAGAFARKAGDQFEPAPVEPGSVACDLSPYITAPGQWRTWPHRHGADAFFAARWRRIG